MAIYFWEKKVSDIPAGDGKIANLFLQCSKASIDRPKMRFVRLSLYSFRHTTVSGQQKPNFKEQTTIS